MKINPIRFLKKVKVAIRGEELAAFKPYRTFFEGKHGLEIGGPSKIFSSKALLPVYNLTDTIDGVNFSANTVWEGTIAEGKNYGYAKGKAGYQFICEGNDLRKVENGTYDFLLSSHNLEHFANPLKAIEEWKRVLKPGGVMLLVLPDRRYTFDHRRSVTTFQHLMDDFKAGMQEDDLSHLDEILRLHDFSMDPLCGGSEQFRERALRNFENRCLHQHVFDEQLLKEIFAASGIHTLFSAFVLPYHIIIMGQKK